MSAKRIRILRIIGQCKTGGTETIALNYYNNLDHDLIGMDFLFYGESLPRFNEVLEANGDSVINVVDYTDNLVKSICEICEVVKKGNYDIIHSQLNTLNIFPLFGAYLGKAKIRIAANHSTANLKYEFKKSIIKYIMRPMSRLYATNYAACSEYAGSWCFGKNKLKEGKIKIIRNAIDLNKFIYSDTIRNQVRINNNWTNRFVIGHAGRFTEQKNHKFIIKVFAEVHKICPKALLVFAGDGHLMKDIKQQVQDLNLEKSVQFLGVRFDLNELMQGMDLFFFPSLYEGFGNVITEAQAIGLHSVVSDMVPHEVKMTELVDFVSLNQSIKVWVDTIFKYSNGYPRLDTHNILRSNGYDIRYAAKDLERYYASLL